MFQINYMDEINFIVALSENELKMKYIMILVSYLYRVIWFEVIISIIQ